MVDDMIDLATPASPDLGDLIASVDRLGAGVLLSNQAIERSNDNIARSNDRIAELSRVMHRSRRQIKIVAASVAFDILLSIFLGFAFNNAATASRQANALSAANKATILASCKNSNDVRTNDIKLWTHVLTLEPATPSTINLLGFVDTTFAPRVC
jgi:hypothetical protein